MPLPSAPSSTDGDAVGQQQHDGHHDHRLRDETEAGQPQFDAVPPTQEAAHRLHPTIRRRQVPATSAATRVDAGHLAQSMMSGWFCSTPSPPTMPASATHEPEAPYTVTPPVPYAPGGPLRNPFPPIADYAFLSDCENTCLISSAGSVEWMCVPRPDSPSVFGAILDRGAGHFRLAPYGVTVPAARRYLPGSLILETTWQTHTGWLIVRDALVMGPWHDSTPGPGPTAAPRWTGTPNTSCCARCAASAAWSSW